MQLIKELVGTKGNNSYNLLSEEDRNKLAFLNSSNPYGGGSPRYFHLSGSPYHHRKHYYSYSLLWQIMESPLIFLTSSDPLTWFRVGFPSKHVLLSLGTERRFVNSCRPFYHENMVVEIP